MLRDRDKPPYHNLDFVETGEHARPFFEVCDQHDTPFEDLVRRFIEATGSCSILDMCCGNSSFGSYLGHMFPTAQIVRLDSYTDEERGYDTDEDPANVSFLDGDANDLNLPLPNAHFQLIVMTWGANHYEEEVGYIGNIGRLLAVGGQAFVRPEPSSLEGQYKQALRGDALAGCFGKKNASIFRDQRAWLHPFFQLRRWRSTTCRS